ncbi:MAG: immunity 8 family protein [Bacteroidales bacterium]|nr:immunity 8 family protein [Bacteroidales bacterium]
MMKSHIINYHSPDVDIDNFTPTIPDEFAFLLQVFVGVQDEPGDECFDIFVCTPKWIERHHSKEAVLIGLHTIIVQGFDLKKLLKAIEELVCIEGSSWQEISNRIGYVGLSEFDHIHWDGYKNVVKCGEAERGN